MEVRQYISQVWDGLNVSTDDTSVYDQFVYNELKLTRNELMRQEINKLQLLDGSVGQVYPNFKLQLTDISECENYLAGDSILKSVDPLPSIIDTNDMGKLIFSVYTNTFRVIERTTFKDWISGRNRRFQLHRPKYFIRNNHLFVVNYDTILPDGMIDCLDINIDAAFEHPEEIEMIINNDPCAYIMDLDFPLPGYIGRRVLEIVKASIRNKYAIPEDTSNNDQEDVQVSQNTRR
jgi:hypothetical protein